MAKWLDKYEQGGMVLKKKTKDNYGKRENANEGYSTAGPGWVGEGTTNKGFNYNGAWGGTMAMGGALPGAVGFTYARTAGSAPANGKYTKKTLPSAQLGIELMPYLLSSAASLAASIPTMEEVKKKAINVIKDSPKLRSALNSGLSYVANTDWGKEKLKNLANNIDPHGYGLGYERAAGKSPVERIYSAAILNKKEDSRKEMDSLLAAGQAYPDDSLRVDLMNQYAGLPQKYNTLKPSAYKPTMGDKNQKYFNSPILDKHVLDDIDVISKGSKVKPVFKTKQDLENFVANYLGEQKQDPKYPDDPTKRIPNKGKGSNYVSILSGLGEMTYGVGEDEKGHYLSYYDNWDLNPYAGSYSLPEDSYYTDINTTNDNLARSIIGNNKENVATKRIGTPTNVYNRIYFDKKTGKPKMKKGGVIKDDMGQWAHPGEVTEIGSNDITMQGVDYPVLGISDTGDTKMMQPGEDYKFDGEKVTEFPMMEKGGWLDKFDDKAQEGKDIPKGYTLPTVTVTSRRFNKYPHISNDNILSSKQLASEFTKRAQGQADIAKRKELANRETVRSYDPEKEDESLLSRAYHIAVNPMTALSYKVKGKDIPDHFERSPDRNILEYATNVINPFSLVDAAASIPGNIKRGEFLQAALNTASILPALSEFRGASYKNIYKYSPYAEKLTGKTRRQIFGDPAYESFLKHGPTTQPKRPAASQQAQWLKFNREASPVYNTGTGENMQIAGTTLFDNNGMRIDADYPFAYFSEGSPWYQGKGREVLTRDNGVERIIVPKEGANLELYPAGESSIIMNPKELTKETINSYAGRRMVLSPFGEAFNPEAFDVYKGKPHWLKGYQKEAPPINKNKIAGSVIKGDRKIFYNELGDEVGSIESFPDIDAQRNINWGTTNEKIPEPRTIANPDYTDVGNKYLQNNNPFAAKRSTLKDIPISGGSTTKRPKKENGGWLNKYK